MLHPHQDDQQNLMLSVPPPSSVDGPYIYPMGSVDTRYTYGYDEYGDEPRVSGLLMPLLKKRADDSLGPPPSVAAGVATSPDVPGAAPCPGNSR